MLRRLDSPANAAVGRLHPSVAIDVEQGLVNDIRKRAGTKVLIAPLEADLAAAARRAARGKLACISIDHRAQSTLAQFGHYLNTLYCARRIALAHDRSLVEKKNAWHFSMFHPPARYASRSPELVGRNLKFSSH